MNRVSFHNSLWLMSAMIRDHEISPLEVVEAHLDQIARVNPEINAFTTVFAEEARAAARKATDAVQHGAALGLLHGIPVTVKDSFDVAGHPTTAGSRLRLQHRAANDATAVANLRAAGAIVIGKTNTPDLLRSYETDNLITGRSNNPWDTSRTPGGSSGGEAAAIAAFCSAGGLGSDGGGSIRIPAHFCGIAGLKPTPGRISSAGHFPAVLNPAGMLTVAGPMARNAQDLRMLFAALAGYDSEDPFSAPVALGGPHAAGRVRAGLWKQFYGVPVDPRIAQTLQQAANALEEIGIPAEDFTPSGLERAPNLWALFFGRLAGRFLKDLTTGREADVHPALLDAIEESLKLAEPSADDLMRAFAARDRMRAGLLRQMKEHQILLTPPCTITAFPHGFREGLFQATMNATFANLLGLPALIIPFAVSSSGLPVGIQLVGRPWEEELLLDTAARLEEVRGPFPSPPGIM
jgi:Asp-tRNA(Asn)/Glu-tRNA(Gln) amidotransferase A subunit family amidase